MRALMIAALALTAVPLATAADAQPGYHRPHHRARVCRTVFRHGHRIRNCFYR